MSDSAGEWEGRNFKSPADTAVLIFEGQGQKPTQKLHGFPLSILEMNEEKSCPIYTTARTGKTQQS